MFQCCWCSCLVDGEVRKFELMISCEKMQFMIVRSNVVIVLFVFGTLE